jgi:1,4-alpha-glucan branching enzyme
MKASKPKRRRITFRFEAPYADKVSLMGDFNQWDETRHKMRKTTRGKWEKTVVIPPGQYEYKFLVDEKWLLDPANEIVCQNCFGSMNSIIVVKLA